MRLTTLTFGIFILFFVGCKTSRNSTITKAQKTKTLIPENTLIDLVITSIDTASVDLYDIIRFYYQKPKNIGIILKKKSNSEMYIVDQKLTLKLCDIGQYATLFRESDTTSIGNVPLIYGQQEGLKDKIDTINFRGHFMTNGVIMNDHKVILDFGDDAIEPVFEVCRQ